MTLDLRRSAALVEQAQPTISPWPSFDEEDIAAVAAVLRSGKVNYWTGTEGRNFEEEFATYVGTRHAVALANGTVALEVALRALGVGPGDEVLTASRTFIASASCATILGAKPVFADVDRESQTLTAETLRSRITPRTRAIIAVHFAGWPCDLDPILSLARENNLRVIEDCAQAHGAQYKGRPVGSIGDIGAFSFCQDKIMTTGGEGGMITLNHDAQWEFARSFKDHGKNFRHSPSPGHDLPGTNGRMTEMQAALGRNALRHLDTWVDLRRRNAAILQLEFEDLPLVRQAKPSATVRHAYYKYYAFLRPERLKLGWTRDRIVHEITARGVPCSTGGRGAIHHEAVFAAAEPTPDLPVTENLAETSLVFLVHPTLRTHEMEWISKTAAVVLRAATR